jgi:type IV pilus assembly protein PilY1
MNKKLSITAVAAMLAMTFASVGRAQTISSEDFTGPTTTNNWYYYNGACLTTGTGVGTGTPGVTPGIIPSCKSLLSSYYQIQRGADSANPVLVGGQNGTACSPTCTQTLPDTPNAAGVNQGALRFTNGYPFGHSQNGAIVSSTPFDAGQGVQITFKTVTYRGDSGGAGADGADGMSFYLIDATQFPNPPTSLPTTGVTTWNGIGSWGGSLGYTCSNSNPPYDGLNGAYIGLGIDEFGNFLNGVGYMPAIPGYTMPTATGDNTALGYGAQPQRIGLRGAGSVSWAYLNKTYPTYYNTTMLNTPALQQAAVKKTCTTGNVWNYSNSATNPTQVTNPTPKLYDYAPIPGAFSVLPAKQIAGEYSAGVYSRASSKAVPIFYNLTITQDGLLSLSYALAGSSAYTSIIKDRSITATNAIPALPASLYFGFAGSSGGNTNIHEIMCFKAAPATQSANSAAVSQQLATKIQGGAQIYFSYYNPTNWTGNLTANGLLDAAGVLSISATANWDAQCVLTGIATSKTCQTTGVAGPTSSQLLSSGRVMLTWNGNDTVATPGNTGIPFEWSGTTGGITSAQQGVLDAGDASANANRLNYLRGDQTNEINHSGVGLFRARDGILGDIVDSSPAWVGPPTSPYALKWKNRYIGTDALLENTGQSYSTFQALEQTRLNVVYVGANDGFLHGFESGSQDSTGAINVTTPSGVATPNDGHEVLAYMPGAVLDAIHQYSSDPAVEPTDASVDYSNSLYAHNFFVDAPPGTGDLFYAGVWHTWLVGGLGAGGAAIYALDITNPSNSATNPSASVFSESNAAALVKGEWSSATISCVNNATCGKNLGDTYGTPLIRRFHNGSWGAVFGNGYGSVTGDAGIFVMMVDPTDGGINFYYLSTGTGTGTAATPCATNCDGIAYVTSADLDGDHITDYVYAGDLKGNVWRFDLTNCSPTLTTTACPGTSWAVTPGPLFKAANSAGVAQPITTPIVLASAIVAGNAPSLMLTFGTGQRTQFTVSSPVTYATGTQTLYGVWDWNFGTWNANSAFSNASLTSTQTGLSSPYTLKRAQLQAQTYTATSTTIGGVSVPIVTTSNTPITWKQCGTTCNTGKFGWFADLPSANEQMVSTPTPYQQGLAVNSTIPANNAILSCTSGVDLGVTYLISPITGGTFTSSSSPGTFTSGFVNSNSLTNMVGLQTNETGALTVVNTQEGTTWLVGQSIVPPAPGQPPVQPVQVKLPPNVTVTRKTWVQLR